MDYRERVYHPLLLLGLGNMRALDGNGPLTIQHLQDHSRARPAQ